ncbi:MAG: hypothetical protein J0L84_01835 [Verrucomicrobia bacterium]|nr:hypothetical protein [Verrucomicrobiota bacterium]
MAAESSWWHRMRQRRAAPGLDSLLAGIGPDAPLSERVAWLGRLVAWVRQDVPEQRLRLILQILDHQEPLRRAVAATLRSVVRETQALDLFAETGLPRAAGFFREAAERLAHRLLPRPPACRDLGDLLDRWFPHPRDARWLGALDAETVQRIAALWNEGRTAGEASWESLRPDLEDALVLLASRIRVIGSAPSLRQRLPETRLPELPFQKLGPAVESLVELGRSPADASSIAAGLNRVRTLIEATDQALDAVLGALEETGVSMEVVYDVERLRAMLRRLELLLEAWGDPDLRPERGLVILSDLIRDNHARRSLAGLGRDNLQLLARSLVERSAETGEHYIARTRAEYAALFRSALGGGVITAFTSLIKISLVSLALAAFLEGSLIGINYAACFVLIQLCGCTLATKQPATTAPALAGRMHGLRNPKQVEALADEILTLIRSQAVGILGNLIAVFPMVLLLDALWWKATGAHWVSPAKAGHILESMDPLRGTLLFAAVTGVLLWLSSVIASWADNAFALLQLRPALTASRPVQIVLGPARAARAAVWLDHQMAGLAGNISLGFLMGYVPQVAAFFGVPLDIRHVTLSTGQLAGAVATLGFRGLDAHTWISVLWGLAGIGALNVGVSFGLALWVAIRARGVRGPERRVILLALLRRLAGRRSAAA